MKVFFTYLIIIFTFSNCFAQDTTGILQFSYRDTKLPIVGYTARVRSLNNKRDTIFQNTETKVRYAPGDYFIEINTFPMKTFKTSISANLTTEIQLPYPGFVALSGNGKVANVSLYVLMQDVYEFVSEISLSKTVKKIKLERGWYKIKYASANKKMKELDFILEPKATKKITLN